MYDPHRIVSDPPQYSNTGHSFADITANNVQDGHIRVHNWYRSSLPIPTLWRTTPMVSRYCRPTTKGN